MGRHAARLALALVALLSGGVLFLSGYSVGARTSTTPGTPAAQAELWAPFWDTYRAIEERYALGPIPPRTLVEGAISGMVEALDDRYSAYYDPEAYQRTLESLSGTFEGIGAQVTLEAVTDGTTASSGDCASVTATCRLTVVAALPDSPAEEVGLQPGDVIDAIDGRSVLGWSVSEATDLIRGPRGTSVVLTLVRGGGIPFDLTIQRAVIVAQEVVTRGLEDDRIGYIALSSFSDAAAEQFIDALRAHLGAGREAIILDLRGNPGGFITAAARIASQFIPSGPIYWTQDATGEQVATTASGDGLAIDPAIRLVVLVDAGSASASEILAGALQDTGRATLVGERTFGKGTIQGWQPLDSNAGGLKLTIAKWLTPSKRWVNESGLTPDVVVGGAASGSTDAVLARAIELLDARGR